MSRKRGHQLLCLLIILIIINYSQAQQQMIDWEIASPKDYFLELKAPKGWKIAPAYEFDAVENGYFINGWIKDTKHGKARIYVVAQDMGAIFKLNEVALVWHDYLEKYLKLKVDGEMRKINNRDFVLLKCAAKGFNCISIDNSNINKICVRAITINSYDVLQFMFNTPTIIYDELFTEFEAFLASIKITNKREVSPVAIELEKLNKEILKRSGAKEVKESETIMNVPLKEEPEPKEEKKIVEEKPKEKEIVEKPKMVERIDGVIKLTAGKREFVLNGEKYTLPIAPVMKAGVIFVPLDWNLFEPLGCKHSDYLSGDSVYINVRKANKKLTFVFDKSRTGNVRILHNDKQIKLEPAPYFHSHHLMLPLSQIYKLLNLNILFE